MTVRAIGKVVDAYQRDRSIQPTFRPHGAIVYDDRLLSWKGADRVSILTGEGRTVMPVVMGTDHTQRWRRICGQADLIDRDGRFYLAVVVDVPEPPPLQPDDWLGEVLGIVNIAADSDGHSYSGAHLNGLRKRHAKLRQRLQKKGTKSAKRLLRRRRRQEQRLATDENHRMAKPWVMKAQNTQSRDCLGRVDGHPRPDRGAQGSAASPTSLGSPPMARVDHRQGETGGCARRLSRSASYLAHLSSGWMDRSTQSSDPSLLTWWCKMRPDIFCGPDQWRTLATRWRPWKAACSRGFSSSGRRCMW